jgi:hypothetical protein
VYTLLVFDVPPTDMCDKFWLLWDQLAGGPHIPLRYGRKDAPGPESPIPIGRLPCETLLLYFISLLSETQTSTCNDAEVCRIEPELGYS